MKTGRHLTRAQIASYIAEIPGQRKRLAIERHLSECGRCASLRNRIEELINPAYAPTITLQDSLKSRILDYAPGRAPAFISAPVRKTRWFFYPAAAAAILAFVFSGYLLITRSWDRPQPDNRMAVNSVYGNVLIDGAAPGTGTALRKVTQVHADKTGLVDIGYGPAYRIRIAGEADIIIGNRLTAGTKQELFLNYIITRARLHSTCTDGAIHYSITTPSAIITSIGTEFLAAIDGSSTEIIMKNGSLRVTARGTGETLTIHGGQKCRIDSRIAIHGASIDEMSRFDSFGAGREDGDRDTKRMTGDGRETRRSAGGPDQAATAEKDAAAPGNTSPQENQPEVKQKHAGGDDDLRRESREMIREMQRARKGDRVRGR